MKTSYASQIANIAAFLLIEDSIEHAIGTWDLYASVVCILIGVLMQSIIMSNESRDSKIGLSLMSAMLFFVLATVLWNILGTSAVVRLICSTFASMLITWSAFKSCNRISIDEMGGLIVSGAIVALVIGCILGAAVGATVGVVVACVLIEIYLLGLYLYYPRSNNLDINSSASDLELESIS